MNRRPLQDRATRALLVVLGLILVGATTAATAIPHPTKTRIGATMTTSAGTLAATAILANPGSTSVRPFHITLEASTPADQESVAGDVIEVRLLFSDAPLMRGASIRIVDSSRKLVRSTPPKADVVDPKQLAVQVDPALPEGTYVVQWRCIADDGHVMRGAFTFDVVGR